MKCRRGSRGFLFYVIIVSKKVLTKGGALVV